jgi:hypothetical protein
MKKFLSILTVSAFLFTAPMAFAKDCDGPDCQASGNFDIGVFAVGGNLDADLATIPNGAAGGISAAGGIGAGEAEGSFESFRFWGRTFNLGSSDAEVRVTAGGATDTNAYQFDKYGDPRYDISIGVLSQSNGVAEAGGYLEGSAEGLAYSGGALGAIAGQATLDGSIVTGSPLAVWDSKGMTMAVAGQGSVGGFVGGGIAAGYGDYQVGADVFQVGYSRAASYRAIDFFNGGQTEWLVSDAIAQTKVTSYGYANDGCIGVAHVAGGYIAAGAVATKTVQFANNGAAIAKSNASYQGASQLGCDFNGAANAWSKTGATTYDGLNGSIMTSAAGASVSNSSTPK